MFSFFYTEYFKLGHSSNSVISFVNNEAFSIYLRLANNLISDKHYDMADGFLELAKDCSSSEEKTLQVSMIHQLIEDKLTKNENMDKQPKHPKNVFGLRKFLNKLFHS